MKTQYNQGALEPKFDAARMLKKALVFHIKLITIPYLSLGSKNKAYVCCSYGQF